MPPRYCIAVVAIFALLFVSGCESLRIDDPEKPTHRPVSHPGSSLPVVICPVSHETVDPDDPDAVAFVHDGRTYLFRDRECMEAFKDDPSLYLDARILRASNIQP